MPFINVKTSCPIANDQELRLKAAFGRAIGLIPGKSEESLMLSFSDSCRMWFGGSQEGPIAMVETAIYGSAAPEDFQRFGQEAARILREELGAAHTYVKLQQTTDWAW